MSKWTSVVDNPPPAHQPVIVCWAGVGATDVFTSVMTIKAGNMQWRGNGVTMWYKTPPTHWMAMPVHVDKEG